MAEPKLEALRRTGSYRVHVWATRLTLVVLLLTATVSYDVFAGWACAGIIVVLVLDLAFRIKVRGHGLPSAVLDMQRTVDIFNPKFY